ncbi:MAG: hypothetical protein KGV56_03795 [Gammaproteobacteria bacterium]|nr:hypothetical protein [Gammaproteobacteria bacterium]
MKKRLLPLVVASFVITPFLSFGAGLGSVRTYSNLNERLRAEIPVLSVKQRGKMSVALAPDAVFSQRGITRSKDVRNLRFSLIKKGQRYYVKVSSVKPVSTPYLNFILELKDEEGKSHREYAVFLDPASPNSKKSKRSSSKSRKQTTASHTSHSDKKKVVVKKERRKTHRKSKKRRVALPTVAGKVGYYGPVKRGETLSGVALKVRPSKDISIQQMIRLLEEANPKLKYGLKADSTIKVPTIKGYSTYQGGTGKAISVAKVKEVNKPSRPATVEKVKVDSKPNRPVAVEKNIKSEVITEQKPVIAQVVSSIQDSVGETSIPAKTDTKNVTVAQTAKEIKTVTLETQQAKEEPKATDVPVVETATQAVQDGIKVSTINEKGEVVRVEADKPQASVQSKIISTLDTTKEQVKHSEVSSADSTPLTTEKPTEVVESKPVTVTKPISKTISANKPVKAEIPEIAESEEGGFSLPFGLSLMPLLAGAGTLLLGLVALLFVRKKRQSSDVDTKKIVLLDEDEIEGEDILSDNEDDLALDDILSVDKEATTTNVTEEVSEVQNNIEQLDENLDTVSLPLDEDKNFEELLSSTDEEPLSSDTDEPFNDELFDLDSTTNVDVSEPLSEMSPQAISTSEEHIETSEEVAEEGGLSFDLDSYSDEIAEEEKDSSIVEEVSDTFDKKGDSLDFNLDEPLQTEVEEPVADKEEVSYTDNGLAFDINDDIVEDADIQSDKEPLNDEKDVVSHDDGLAFEMSNDSVDETIEKTDVTSNEELTNDEEIVSDSDDGLTFTVNDDVDVEDTNIQLDEEEISDRDDGLAFEINDKIVDDVVEDTVESKESVSDTHSIDFTVNDEVANVETDTVPTDENTSQVSESAGVDFEVGEAAVAAAESDVDKTGNTVPTNQMASMVTGTVADNVSDVLPEKVSSSENEEKVAVKEKVAMKEPKPFTVDKVAGSNVDLSSFAQVNLATSKPKSVEVKASFVEEEAAEPEVPSIRDEKIEEVKNNSIIDDDMVVAKTDDALESVDVAKTLDENNVADSIEITEKDTETVSEVSSQSMGEIVSNQTQHQPDEPAINERSELSMTEDLITLEKETTSSKADREPVVSDSYLERSKARKLEVSKRVNDSNNGIVTRKTGTNNDTVSKGYRHTEIEMKMAMAETFISVSNYDRAKELLQYIIEEGSVGQVEKAKSILREIG